MIDFGPPEQLVHSTVYWGRRSGVYEPRKAKNMPNPWGWIFKIKRGSAKSSDNNGPVGHKRRWYFARAWSLAKRPIRNPEHQRRREKDEK